MIETDKLHTLVDAVVGLSVSLPERSYYINYRLFTGVFTNNQWAETTEEVHIGPYPHALASYISQHCISETRYTNGYCSTYTSKPTLGLKPRRNSVWKAGPTQEQVEALLLRELRDKLDTYRRVHEWYSLSYVQPQTTKEKGK
ncbi:hypothetical protein [Microcoleus phage My-WqHQDG]|nr:hypothetical protein [Microcoleus phage My-WqHQDG]